MALAGAVAIDDERGEQDATVMANRDGTMMSGRPETADLGMKNDPSKIDPMLASDGDLASPVSPKADF